MVKRSPADISTAKRKSHPRKHGTRMSLRKMNAVHVVVVLTCSSHREYDLLMSPWYTKSKFVDAEGRKCPKYRARSEAEE